MPDWANNIDPPEIEPQAEEMIAKWLEYCNLWMRHDFPDDDAGFQRDYVLQYHARATRNLEQLIIHCHLWLNDELNSAQLLGVFDVEDADPELRYVAAEVDTMWRDFWAKDGPEGNFTNRPS